MKNHLNTNRRTYMTLIFLLIFFISIVKELFIPTLLSFFGLIIIAMDWIVPPEDFRHFDEGKKYYEELTSSNDKEEEEEDESTEIEIEDAIKRQKL